MPWLKRIRQYESLPKACSCLRIWPEVIAPIIILPAINGYFSSVYEHPLWIGRRFPPEAIPSQNQKETLMNVTTSIRRKLSVLATAALLAAPLAMPKSASALEYVNLLDEPAPRVTGYPTGANPGPGTNSGTNPTTLPPVPAAEPLPEPTSVSPGNQPYTPDAPQAINDPAGVASAITGNMLGGMGANTMIQPVQFQQYAANCVT